MESPRSALRRLGERGRLRALAREAGISVALLPLIVKGERELTCPLAERLMRALKQMRNGVQAEARAASNDLRRCAQALADYTSKPDHDNPRASRLRPRLRTRAR